jgi:RNA polymerase sigma-70 factor (ECF subfamily)
MSEKQLVASAKAGDFAAFSQLVEKYQARVFGLAKRMTRNEDDAQDILQETMLKAIDKLDQFRGDSSFGTWLYSIALNEGRAFLRREQRAELRTLEEFMPTAGSGAPRNLQEWRNPHSELEQQQIREALDEAIDELRAEYSIPFVLRYLEELPVKEVAKVMQLSEAATKSRILRARLFLREKLEPIMSTEANNG